MQSIGDSAGGVRRVQAPGICGRPTVQGARLPAVGRVGQLASKLMPRGPFDAARQWLLFAGAYYLYRIVRGMVDGHANIAYEHARSIVDFERGLHSFIELDVQRWAIDNPFFIHVADW